MAPKRRRATEVENKQVVQKRSSSKITRSQTQPVKMKINNSPVVVFAHGAGAPSSSDWMIRWKKLLADALHAVEVVTFDYPYISERKPPPKAEKLVEFHSGYRKENANSIATCHIILVGKSMGSRVSCMVAAEDGIEASAVVCLGYPLKEQYENKTWEHVVLTGASGLGGPVEPEQIGKKVEDCKMVVKEIVSRLLEEEEKLEWWFEQDIDKEEERFEGDEDSGEV
ncbi:KAT8 regulatory NSL complex subunit 3 [Tanacetum coccineum]